MLQTKAEALVEEESRVQSEKAKVTEEVEKKKEKKQSREMVDRMLKRKKKKAEKMRKRLEEKKKNEKKAAKRRTAAQELLSTETTYVKNLMILTNGFVLPLETSGILNASEISNVFSNVKVILKFHKEFLKSLKEKVVADEEGDQCFGEVILKMTPYLKMYTQYGTNYDTALSTVQHLTKSNTKFANFLQQNMENPTFGGLTLSGYLIMPIQRIPRYKMLLEVILQNTSETHPDYGNLQKALSEIEGVAFTVNDAIEQESCMNTLIKIQGMVNLQVVVPARKFVREGTMRTTCFMKKKRKKTRHSSEIVLVSPETSENNKRLTASVSLRKMPRGSEESATRSSPNLGVVHRSTSLADLTPLRWSNEVPNAAALPNCNVYLCNDIIIIAHGKDKSKAIAPQLVTAWVKHSDMFSKSFELVTLDGTYLMVVKDQEEKESWIKSIEDAIEENRTKTDKQELRDQYEPRVKAGMWKVVSKNSPHDEDESDSISDSPSPSKTYLHLNPVFNSVASEKAGSRGSLVGRSPGSPRSTRREDRGGSMIVSRPRASTVNTTDKNG